MTFASPGPAATATAIDPARHGDHPVALSELFVYPVKSCGGQPVREAIVVETGLEFDRAWMLVDPDGVHVTQRTLPRMALVSTRFKLGELVLRAPGMLALHVDLDRVDADTTRQVTVWRDEVAAYDMGNLAAEWFSNYLGTSVRMVRFDPTRKRISDRAWTGDLEGEAAFADGFAALVVSQASIDELNRRLVAAGDAPVTAQRFRPNLVLTGLQAHQEDELDELSFDTPEGPIVLKLVKPCTRCAIPNIDPLTAEVGRQPNDMLATYRSDPRVGGAVTFGMNAIVVRGADCLLKAGATGTATYRF